ncbi:hypothetical protein FSP39_015760 [Pinctada imbricata]|uniref:Uncharacterized protein n=1 Tax=Pinctada imbricata TaxID=66713 RepID=A0AA88YPT8_PINIB|nr:hypothetical protein FSP39_015760 [Pinctada imbricata]
MRSGSTLTSGILQQSGKVFFSMEPLWGIYKRCYRRKHDVCCRNNTCRSPNGELEGLHVATGAISDIFNCKFDKLGKEVLSSFTFFSVSSGYTGLIKNRCFGLFRNKTLTELCLKYLTSMCEASNGVIVKSLRLSAETLTFLKDIVPDMKIVHLFRDPRGVLHSRKNIGDFIDKNTNISIYARQLCNRMLRDIDILKSSKIHYIPLRYECLSDNPNVTVRKVYKGLNITVTKLVEHWIENHMKAKSRNSGGYGFQYKNSSVVAHSWRYSLVGRARRLKILIFTYMRSGSTLTSGIVQQSGNAFFSMEPLWGIYKRCYRRKHDVCCRNDKCRSPTGELEGLQVAIAAIKDIFNCEFNKLGDKVLSSFTFFCESSGNTRLRNNRCFEFSRNETLTEWCLKYLTSVCEASSGVIVKTLRLSAETLSFLKDIVPDMKIVHLFRDPRGVLNSRKNFGDLMDRNTNISIYARQLCNRMSHDIDVLKSLGIHYIP